MTYLFEQVKEAATAIADDAGKPEVGVILGSGLGVFAAQLTDTKAVPYARIPNFPPARVEGHAGQLLFATFKGVRIAVLSGRVHYYEGYSLDLVTIPTRALAVLGVKALLVTNASGGIREDLEPGDLMLIEDHINLMGANPLRGPKDPRLGLRFPDMTHAYDPDVRQALRTAADGASIPVKSGVYAALAGPSYETPAEIRMLRTLGADAVGMSTVPEAIVANQMGLMVGGVSCVGNKAAGLSGSHLSHTEVMQETQKAASRFCRLLSDSIPLVGKVVRERARQEEQVQSESVAERRSVGKGLKKGAKP